MKNIFSINRFGRLASTEFMASRHQFITIAWVTAVIYVGLLFISSFLFDEPLVETNHIVYKIMKIGALLASLVLISASFKPYHNSMSCPRVMTLPATKFEKFTYSTLYNVVLIPGLIFGIVAGINYILCNFVGEITVTTLTAEGNVVVRNDLTDSIMGSFLTLCFYFLGATFFRRAQFILSSVSLIGLAFIASASLVLYIKQNYVPDSDDHLTFFRELDSALNIVTYISIPVTLFLAWLRFRTLQIRK